MKQKMRRLLIAALCTVLIAGSAPDAYVYTAAGAEEVALEESAVESVEETPAEEPADPPAEAEATPEPEPEITPEPENTPEPTPEATLPAETPTHTEAPQTAEAPAENTQEESSVSESIIDYAETADHSPEFCEGYAVIVQPDAPAWDAPDADAEIIALLSRGTVWALERTDEDAPCDRLKVAFCAAGSEDDFEVIVCWMDADYLRPMEPDTEIKAYLDSCAEADDVEYADTDRLYPLLPIECKFAAQDAPDTESDSASAVPNLISTQEISMAFAAQALAPDETLTIAAPAKIGAKMQGTITISHESGHFSAYELEYDASAIEITASETDVYTFTAKSVAAPRTAQLRAVNEAGETLGTAEIKVLPAPEIGDIYFESNVYNLGLGDTSSILRAQIAEDRYCELSYASSDPETVSIDEATGLMQANAATADDACVTITVCDKNNPAVHAKCSVYVHAAPQSIYFTSESIRMAQGERVNLNARIASLPEAAVGLSCTFESSNPDCASIDESSVLTANASGTAVITARAYNGAVCTATVRVLASSSAVSVSPASLSIGENSSASFTIAWQEDCGNLYTLEYDTGLITIDSIADGALGEVVTFSTAAAERAAHTRINVLDANGGVIAALPVDIYPAPHAGEVYFAETDHLIEIGLGETERAVQARCIDGKLCDFIYTSSNPAIVAVDADTGALTPNAVTEGDQCAVITATAKNNPEASATCRVIVTNAPESICFKMSELRIGVGERFDLREAGLTLTPESAQTQLTYTSTDDSIASVGADGIVEGKTAGTVLISAATHNRKTASITVIVAKQNGAPAFEEKTYRIGEGMRLAVNVLHGDDYGGSYTVKSDNNLLRVLSVERDASGTDRIILSAFAANAKTDAVLRLIDDRGAEIDSCTVSIYPAPDSIACDPASVSIGLGESAKLIHIVNTPAESLCTYTYKSDAPEIISVDADGTLTAKSYGTARIRVRASGSGVEAFCTVTVLNAPTFVRFDQESYSVDLSAETPTVLQPVIDEGCEASFTYQVQDETIATVDPDGTVRPLKAGATTVTVTTHNALTASAELNVYDSLMPTSLAWAEGFPPDSLLVGNSVQLQIVYEPETAQPDIVWSSSDSSIATVDPVTGLVTGVSYGYVTITATSQRNPELMLSFTLVVLSVERCLKIPERRIDYSDLDLSVSSDYNTLMRHMNSVLSDISNVQESANEELEMLYTQGAFSEWEYGARKADIARGFSMYRFPWDTTSTQPYWKAANSENGVKDFKPKIVYFGPGYTQTNRVYNVDKLLSENRYTSLGNGGYRLNRNNLLKGTYCGNDCSAFVSMCLWGTTDNQNRNAYTTSKIATSSYYYTVSDWQDLRPGDLINSSGHHVVMFLYYTNAAKTQMMILEQGGGEYGTNTVSCSLRGVAYYRDGGYSIRRCCYYES